MFEFTVYYEGIPQSVQITLLGRVDLLGPKIKMIETGLPFHVKVKGQEFGGQIKTILQLKEIALEWPIQSLQAWSLWEMEN